MLSFPSTLRIYLHTQPADRRKGADGLCGIVRGQFQGDPQDGSLFLFFNRRPGTAAQRWSCVKMLHWDGTGYWIYYKTLESGTFESLASPEPRVQIDALQLAMLLAGVSLHAPRRKRYARVA
jgi:transposase